MRRKDWKMYSMRGRKRSHAFRGRGGGSGERGGPGGRALKGKDHGTQKQRRSDTCNTSPKEACW